METCKGRRRGGGGEDGIGSEDNDEEDEKVALATADAAEAQAASVVRSTRQRNNSLIHQSASFRPHMHLQMQALSNRHNGTFSTRFVRARVVCGITVTSKRRWCHFSKVTAVGQLALDVHHLLSL